jgi:hypothetical protein
MKGRNKYGVPGLSTKSSINQEQYKSRNCRCFVAWSSTKIVILTFLLEEKVFAKKLFLVDFFVRLKSNFSWEMSD